MDRTLLSQQLCVTTCNKCYETGKLRQASEFRIFIGVSRVCMECPCDRSQLSGSSPGGRLIQRGPKPLCRQKQAFPRHHRVRINYPVWPQVLGTQRRSYQAGYFKDSECIPRSWASPENLWNVQGLGTSGPLSYIPLPL